MDAVGCQGEDDGGQEKLEYAEEDHVARYSDDVWAGCDCVGHGESSNKDTYAVEEGVLDWVGCYVVDVVLGCLSD